MSDQPNDQPMDENEGNTPQPEVVPAHCVDEQWRADLLVARDMVRTTRANIVEIDAQLEVLKGSRKSLLKQIEEDIAYLEEVSTGKYQRRLTEEEARAKAAEVQAKQGELYEDDWRGVSVRMLDLTDALCQTLEDADLRTVGDIADWSEQNKLLQDIQGVGDANADKIEKALDAFWAQRGPKQSQ